MIPNYFYIGIAKLLYFKIQTTERILKASLSSLEYCTNCSKITTGFYLFVCLKYCFSSEILGPPTRYNMLIPRPFSRPSEPESLKSNLGPQILNKSSKQFCTDLRCCFCHCINFEQS